MVFFKVLLSACLVALASAGYPQQEYVGSQYLQGSYSQPQYARYGGVQYSHPAQNFAYDDQHYSGQYYPGHPTVQYAAAPQIAPAVRRTIQIAAPQQQLAYSAAGARSAAILRQASDLSYDGSYTQSFESADGTAVQESGALKPFGPEGTQSASGSYTYISPEGRPITTTWIADENGFRAEGEHLPKGPEGYTRSL